MAIRTYARSTIWGLDADLLALTQADAAEAATRAAAIIAEAQARVAAVDTLTANLATEVTRATGEDTTLTTNLAAEIARATAAEGLLTSNLTTEVNARAAADQALGLRIDALGNALNYVGTLNGGADVASAYDLAQLTQKDAGDYYKVAVSGYFVIGSGSAFHANQNDGLVWNLSAGVDIIDNTNSVVTGTANFVAVTGTTETGFVVDVDTAFKDRVATLETGLSTEISRSTAAEATLQANITAEASARSAADVALESSLKAYADNAALMGGSLTQLENLTVTANKIVLSKAPKGGLVGILNFAQVRYLDANGSAFDAPVTVDATDISGKTFIITVDTNGQWDGKSVTVQYQYVNV